VTTICAADAEVREVALPGFDHSTASPRKEMLYAKRLDAGVGVVIFIAGPRLQKLTQASVPPHSRRAYRRSEAPCISAGYVHTRGHICGR